MRIQLYILNMEEGNNGVKKVLRSMIHEVFPFDLRVEIDLLSRRRDISNAEKQEEFVPVFVDLEEAIKVNEEYVKVNTLDSMIERELNIWQT